LGKEGGGGGEGGKERERSTITEEITSSGRKPSSMPAENDTSPSFVEPQEEKGRGKRGRGGGLIY